LGHPRSPFAVESHILKIMITPRHGAIPAPDIPDLVAKVRAASRSGRMQRVEWRLQQLAGLGRLLREREGELVAALQDDLGKPTVEAFAAEIAYPAREVRLAQKMLRKWLRPERAAAPLFAWPGKCRIVREPLGVVLIIGPWNYPVQLMLAPLIGALAAGNGVLLKPSEHAPAVGALLARRLPEYVDAECIQVVEGGVEAATALLAERFDHIFYTGNAAVGRIVMTAAAKHLTPVTLELGGKCPCIVDERVDLEVAARRIVWGKFYNAGQTCIAPDYVLVHKAVEDALLARLKQTLIDFYGPDPRASKDYGRIVNVRHHRRLVQLLPGSGDVFAGGDAIEPERYLAPTILRNVPADAPAMAEEIFGPILPVLPVSDLRQATAFVNSRPKPLVLYLFSNDRAAHERVLSSTTSGGAVINHTLMHEVIPALPFGGVGESGIGAYHGRASFETFSHRKSVLIKSTWPDLSLQYPPYNESKQKWLRRLV
jgi:aldehyde dehydrogenase (NAD+)